jgi:predicted RNase H-like HicB family nuclease
MPFIINQRRPYRIYVEEGTGGAMAHVAELPGCFAVGSSAPLAVAGAPKAIAGFLAWLKAHREPLVPEAIVSRPTMNDLSVAEVRRGGAPLKAGSRAALFDFDTVAWDDYKLERTLRWLSYSRADLLGKIEGFTEQELKARLVAPDRSLWATLWHVANAEFGYIDQAAGPLEGVESVTESDPSDVLERLAAVREILLRRAHSVPPEKRAEVVQPIWTDKPGESWTLPKSLRRALEHELEHLREF